MDRATLVKKRAVLKATLTMQQNVIANFTINALDDYNQLATRLDYINNIYPRYDEVQGELEFLQESEEPDLIERQVFEYKFFTLVARCKTLLQESEYNPESPIAQVVEQPPSPTQINNIVNDHIKLLLCARCPFSPQVCRGEEVIPHGTSIDFAPV